MHQSAGWLESRAQRQQYQAQQWGDGGICEQHRQPTYEQLRARANRHESHGRKTVKSSLVFVFVNFAEALVVA
jgi:hypothetical protein